MIDFWRQLPFSRHSLFFPTVAFSLSWLVWLCFNVVIEFWQQFLVVCIDYLLNVIHAAVADFNCVLIIYFAEWAAFGEAFVYKLQEILVEILQEMSCLCYKQATMRRKSYSLLTQDRRQNRHHSKKRSLRHAQRPQAKLRKQNNLSPNQPTKVRNRKDHQLL